MNKLILKLKQFISKVKEHINEHPFLGGFLTGGVITLLIEIILLVIFK